MSQSFYAFVAASLVVLSAPRALAQLSGSQSTTAQSSAQDEAAERFERGVELYDDGALEAALVEFERAHSLTLDYRVLYNIARVQTERHRYVEAIGQYERYLAEGGHGIQDDRREEVKRELETLKRRVAELYVESNVSGAELLIDDVSVGTLPLLGPVLINPGSSRIRLEKFGYAPASQDIKVAGGDKPRLILNLSKADGVGAPASQRTGDVTSPPSRAPSRRNLAPFWVSAGTTLALGATAGTFGVLVLSNRNHLDDEYDAYPVDRNRVDELQEQGRLYAILADAFTAGAIVGAGISAYFLIKPPKSKRSTMRDGLSDLRLTPTAGGASFSGRF